MLSSREEAVVSGNSFNIAMIYHFLAGAMKFPDCHWLQAEYPAAMGLLLEGLELTDEAEALHKAISDDDACLETLQVEYTRLFLNAIPQVIAPPYASIYLGADGMLYGSSAEKVRSFYREQGFDLAAEADIPDHLCLELEFLALLAEEGKFQEEELFLARHFRPWFPRFQQRILRESRHPFYAVLVNLIDIFTREEKGNGVETNET